LLRIQHQPLDVTGIAPDEQWPQDAIDGGTRGGYHVVAEGLPPADEAFVGGYLDQQGVRRLPGLAAPLLGIGGTAAGVGNAQDEGLDRCNLHVYWCSAVFAPL